MLIMIKFIIFILYFHIYKSRYYNKPHKSSKSCVVCGCQTWLRVLSATHRFKLSENGGLRKVS